MLEQIATQAAEWAGHMLELTGVTIISAGAVGTLLIFLYRAARSENLINAAALFRSSFGRAILLGLEFLIAGDIINTVAVRPTLESVAVLAGIVLIRTFLSFSLELEIEGRWPWQRKRGEQRQV
jgi:uncharacterized membrane protein